MNGGELADVLREGRRVYGTLIVSPSPRWPEAVGALGLDFVFIDTEHIALGREGLSWMCQTYRAMRLAPLVRIPSPDPFEATKVLDGGASGVIVPYVETAEQVRQLRGAVKLRPLKGDKLQRALKGAPLEPELAAYLSHHNREHVLVVNIESESALDALDEILAVDGLDAVLVGPHDLSCSLGVPEQYDHPHFTEAVEDIIKRARARGVGAGVHVFYDGGLEQEIAWAALGANLIVHSADILAFKHTVQRELGMIKRAFGEEEVKDVADINI